MTHISKDLHDLEAYITFEESQFSISFVLIL